MAIFRLIGITTLLGVFFVFALKEGIGKKNEAPKAQNGSSLALFQRDAIEKNQTPRTTVAQSGPRVTAKLAGRFTPDDEHLLIEQLTREGYVYFSSYHLNVDGSAVIAAMHGQQAIQPIVTIAVNKDGNATSKE